MKRREGREYEGGNQGRARDERENLRKFLFFFLFHSNTETSNLFHIQQKQRMMNRGQNREGKTMMMMMTQSRGGRGGRGVKKLWKGTRRKRGAGWKRGGKRRGGQVYGCCYAEM